MCEPGYRCTCAYQHEYLHHALVASPFLAVVEHHLAALEHKCTGAVICSRQDLAGNGWHFEIITGLQREKEGVNLIWIPAFLFKRVNASAQQATRAWTAGHSYHWKLYWGVGHTLPMDLTCKLAQNRWLKSLNVLCFPISFNSDLLSTSAVSRSIQMLLIHCIATHESVTFSVTIAAEKKAKCSLNVWKSDFFSVYTSLIM